VRLECGGFIVSLWESQSVSDNHDIANKTSIFNFCWCVTANLFFCWIGFADKGWGREEEMSKDFSVLSRLEFEYHLFTVRIFVPRIAML
jgi:hypothetical protein